MTLEENEIRKLNVLCDEYAKEIKLLQDKLDFANKTSAEAVERYFEQQKKIKEQYKQISELEIKLSNAIDKAKLETAKEIFTEMYTTVREAEDFTIIVNADDIKNIAKRHGIRF